MQNAPSGVYDPIVFRLDSIQLSPAKSKTLTPTGLCPVAVVSLAASLFRRRYADTVATRNCGQNENRHKTAFKTDTFLIDPQKIGAFRYPIYFRQAKT